MVGRELYDHEDDPLENSNIAEHAPEERLQKLSALLKAHPV